MVTAYNVESYRLLKEDPQDRSAELLEKISLRLSSLSINSAFVNSTEPPLRCSPFNPSASDVAINVLLFISLGLSLATALFVILVQSWIREYQILDYYSEPSRRAYVRQTRFNALRGWFIPDIIRTLALLLQAGLVAFFAGLITMLWTVNDTVGLAILFIAGAFLILYLNYSGDPCGGLKLSLQITVCMGTKSRRLFIIHALRSRVSLDDVMVVW